MVEYKINYPLYRGYSKTYAGDEYSIEVPAWDWEEQVVLEQTRTTLVVRVGSTIHVVFGGEYIRFYGSSLSALLYKLSEKEQKERQEQLRRLNELDEGKPTTLDKLGKGNWEEDEE